MLTGGHDCSGVNTGLATSGSACAASMAIGMRRCPGDMRVPSVSWASLQRHLSVSFLPHCDSSVYFGIGRQAVAASSLAGWRETKSRVSGSRSGTRRITDPTGFFGPTVAESLFCAVRQNGPHRVGGRGRFGPFAHEALDRSPGAIDVRGHLGSIPLGRAFGHQVLDGSAGALNIL